ncbi:Ced-3p [Globodera pallida]|nr:Ced-3p [Globodera pallida]
MPKKSVTQQKNQRQEAQSSRTAYARRYEDDPDYEEESEEEESEEESEEDNNAEKNLKREFEEGTLRELNVKLMKDLKSGKNKLVQYCERNQDNVYWNLSVPRGLCLIINNVNFARSSKRQAANKDIENIQELMDQLKYEIILEENLTAKEMLECIKLFAKNRKHRVADRTVARNANILKAFSTIPNIYAQEEDILQLFTRVNRMNFLELSTGRSRHGRLPDDESCVKRTKFCAKLRAKIFNDWSWEDNFFDELFNTYTGEMLRILRIPVTDDGHTDDADSKFVLHDVFVLRCAREEMDTLASDLNALFAPDQFDCRVICVEKPPEKVAKYL